MHLELDASQRLGLSGRGRGRADGGEAGAVVPGVQEGGGETGAVVPGVQEVRAEVEMGMAALKQTLSL